MASLAGGTLFTKLDLSNAYQQVKLDETSKQFVIINTHKGLFCYTRLPFGVSSAPGIFQQIMESLLQNIPGVVVYIDDILISGKSEEEHLKTLEIVLAKLEEAGLRVRKDKCSFMIPEISFLGYKIDAHGIHPIADKVTAIVKARAPTSVSQLKSYLGLLTYYNRFIPNVSNILAPLYKLLRRHEKWKWTALEQQAFDESKTALLNSQILVHFDSGVDIVLACDASCYGIGAVLSHHYADG